MKTVQRIAVAFVVAMAACAVWLCFLPRYWSDDGFVMFSCGLGSNMAVGSPNCPPPPPGAISMGHGYVVPHAVLPSAAGIVALLAAATLCMLAAWLISTRRYIWTTATVLVAAFLALTMDGLGQELNPVDKFALGSTVLAGWLTAGLLVCLLSVVLAVKKPAVGSR